MIDLFVAQIIFLCLCFIVGAILGSFACCQAWRLRLKADRKNTVAEKKIGKRSLCLSCGHQLGLVENIPIISWLIQGGKCRQCKKKIGVAELLSEISLGLTVMGVGFLLWPQIVHTIHFSWSNMVVLGMIIVLIICLVFMWILMIYDGKWGQMPTRILAATNVFAVFFAILKFSYMLVNGTFLHDALFTFLQLLGAIAILAGIYLILYILSKERLVGSGDWLLALPIALILGNWQSALIVLFVSNFFASIYGIIKKIKTGSNRIYFGPFLVIAFVITLLFFSNW